jgi:hypothetical protein
MIRAMRLLNAIEAGTTSGAQLQTLIADDPGRLAELNVLLGMRGQARRMAASSTAMAAVAASSTAMAAVAASSTAMNAVNANDQAVRIWMLAGTDQVYSNFANVADVAASSTAMNAVAASSTAMAAVAASSTAMNAILKSSTARSAICANGVPNTNLQATRSTLLTTLSDASKFTKVLNSVTQDGASSYGGSPTPAWGNTNAAELIVIVEKAGPWSSGNGANAMWRHLQDASYQLGSSNTGTYSTTTITDNAVCIGGIQYTESGDAGIIVSAWKAI